MRGLRRNDAASVSSAERGVKSGRGFGERAAKPYIWGRHNPRAEARRASGRCRSGRAGRAPRKPRRVSETQNGADGGPGDTAPVALEEEMRRSYLDYAMSVIVSRALPDAR